jgi:hypothetical protein
MSIVYRVAWETGGTSIEQHAVDYATQFAAELRMDTLKNQGISRRVWYRTEGDGPRPCPCEQHQPTKESA